MSVTTIPSAGLTLGAQVNFRNLIINGDMSIAQRGTSATGLTNGSSPYQTVDRWQFNESGAPSFQFTMSQSTTVPTGQGFGYSTKFDCTTAQSSLASGDFLAFRTALEGQMLQSIKKGTSNAESLSLSFWVRSNKTGTFGIFLNETDNNRQNTQTYTISSADTWEKKTLTFAPDTTGSITNDNGSSLYLHFVLGCGTSFTSGTFTENSWEATTQANRCSTSQVNLADSTSNEWYITGVQLEVGRSASDFEFLPYDVNLQRCMRYLQQIGKNVAMNGNTPTGGNRLLQGQREASGSAAAKVIYYLPVPLRTNPTLSKTDINFRQDGTNTDFNSMSGSLFGGILELSVTNTSDFNVAKAMQVRCTSADSFIRFDSEL